MKKGKVAVLLGGGMGKMLVATSLLPKLKAKYGELLVVNPYPEVFFCNPHVYRNLSYNEKYLYEDYLKEVPVLCGEPYLTDAYRFDKKHLIEAYCDLYGLDYSEGMRPQLFFSPEEEAFGKQQVQQLGAYIIMHITGGTSYYSPQNANNKPVHSRDWPIPLAQTFVDLFQKKYPTVKIVQIALPTEPQLKNIQVTNMPSRALFPFIKNAITFVGIDGFLNHVSAACNKQGVILWGGTDVSRLGYSHNVNLTVKSECSEACHKTDFYSHLGGKEMSCAFQYICMQHKPTEVLEEISKILDTYKEQIDGAQKSIGCVDGACKGNAGVV